jgi:deoxyribodipyrimidine photo-lyase
MIISHHIHIFHRSLRLNDNTSLIAQIKTMGNPIIPIFIFTPEQINPKENKYFSNGSVQFMIESLIELSSEIKSSGGKLYFFYGDSMNTLISIHKLIKISSISFNYEYTPYGKAREQKITEWAQTENIHIICEEDYSLFKIRDGQVNKPSDSTPYLVYTPFMTNIKQRLTVRPIDNFSQFKFKLEPKLSRLKYYIPQSKITQFYVHNPNSNVIGGRTKGLQILKSLKKFKTYSKDRDSFLYETTYLSAYIKFNVVSIREIYHRIVQVLGSDSGLIRELIWREFYLSIYWNFPRMLESQITPKNLNKSFKQSYDLIKFNSPDKSQKMTQWTNAFLNGRTGFPIIDANVRDINKRNYMHNRGRMIVASFLAKDLHLDFRWIEQWFATRLIDYDPVSNSGGVQWSVGNGTDAQPWFRIFNPWTQQKNYDPTCEFIYKHIDELAQVSPKDIHNWYDPIVRAKYPNVTYPEPILSHDQERLQTIKIYNQALKKLTKS